MRLTFREKYGPKITITLFVALLWFLATKGYNQDAILSFLFPLNWLDFLPWSEDINAYLSPYMNSWWMLVDISISLFVWVFLFFLVRGAYYICLGLEGPSMWFVFALFVGIGLFFIYLVLRPAFDQMDVWWGNWPGMGVPDFPE